MDRLVYVGLDTYTIDGADQGVIVNLDECDFVPDGDDYADETVIDDLARTNGVAVEDLWSAYVWRRSLVEGGAIGEVEAFVERWYSDRTVTA